MKDQGEKATAHAISQAHPLALVFGAASLLAGGARANPDCPTLPNPVYVVGSTAIGPVVTTIASCLAAQTPPISIVYDGDGLVQGGRLDGHQAGV